MAKNELFEPKKTTQEATVTEEKTNGDFQKLMEKDVVLDKGIQDVLTKDAGRCDRLNEEQRADYINYLCGKIGIDPTFRPVDLIKTKNGIKPYLNKGASELIRDIRKISIDDMQIKDVNGMWVATCRVRNAEGRCDTDIGVCLKDGTSASPMNQNDSLMKAVTKAKRRATLSMCGLGAIIEEAHPTEYNGEAETQECKSQILLEDEPTVKRIFRDVVLSKIDENDLPATVWESLVNNAKRLAQTDKFEDAATWLQEKGIIKITKDEEGNVTKATIKEAANGKTTKE